MHGRLQSMSMYCNALMREQVVFLLKCAKVVLERLLAIKVSVMLYVARGYSGMARLSSVLHQPSYLKGASHSCFNIPLDVDDTSHSNKYTQEWPQSSASQACNCLGCSSQVLHGSRDRTLHYVLNCLVVLWCAGTRTSG